MSKKYIIFLVEVVLIFIFSVVINLEKTGVAKNTDALIISSKPLWCYEKSSKYFWESSVKYGCVKDGQSLGPDKIATPDQEANELDQKVKIRFLAAQAQANIEGVNIQITSGYRSKAKQLMLFEQAVRKYKTVEEASKWVLPPDFSHHPRGIAIDVNYPAGPAGAKWLEINGNRFGLCRVYENEWWHFEPLIAPGEICPNLVPNALTKLN